MEEQAKRKRTSKLKSTALRPIPDAMEEQAKQKQTWWQKIKQHWVAIGVVGIILVVVIGLILVGYWFDWTGFNGHNKVSTAHTIGGSSSGTVIRTEEYQPGKSLWDWLQLLIIPIVLGTGGYLLNLALKKSEREATLDHQREEALQGYIDKMSELLLKEHLRESVFVPHDDKSYLEHILRRLSETFQIYSEPKPEVEVRTIARARTLTVLSRLDSERKKSILQFLHESSLLDIDGPVIELSGADLSKANLKGAHLSEASLNKVNFSGANFSEASLSRADLKGADLLDADLSRASFYQANLSETNLTRADLSRANRDKSFAGEIIVAEANLRGANLTEANLTEANLTDANLTDANLSKACPHLARG